MVDLARLANHPKEQVWASGHVVWRTAVTNEVVICKHADAPVDTDCTYCDGRGWRWDWDDDAVGGWSSGVCNHCHGKPMVHEPTDRMAGLEAADGNDDLFEDCD